MIVNISYRKNGHPFSFILRRRKLLFCQKNRTKPGVFSFRFSKWLILASKTARSVVQNDSFCRAKWGILECKMTHSESSENVKKTQVVRSQLFITFSYFARTRPSAFYFAEHAVISYNKCYFVSIIQHYPSHHRWRVKGKFSHPTHSYLDMAESLSLFFTITSNSRLIGK